MKFFESNKNKLIAGIVVGLVIICAAITLIKLIPVNQTIQALNDEPQTEEITAPEETTTPAETTTLAETTKAPETTTIPKTTTPESTTTASSETTPKATEITLAPVEIPDHDILSILEENDVQIVDNPPTPTQTTPPPGMPAGAQGTDKYGDYYKRVDGVKYVWHPVLGWCRDSEDGNTIIMDVEASGESAGANWN